MSTNPNLHISDYLIYYLSTLRPNFAVMLNGEWGCGKTYFIKRFSRWSWLKFCNPFKSRGHFLRPAACYISLYGTADIAEVEERIWRAALFSDIRKYIVMAFIIGLLIFFGSHLFLSVFPTIYNWGTARGIEFWSFATPGIVFVIVLGWRLAKTKLLRSHLSGNYLIFDDFERSEIERALLLGYINMFVEHWRLHVIIIGNEKDIDLQSYQEIREKTIGVTFLFQANNESVLPALISAIRHKELRKIISANQEWFIDKVLTPQKNGSTNYRALQYCFSDFSYFFQDTSDTRLKNPRIWKILIPQFFSLKYSLQLSEIGITEKMTRTNAKGIIRFGLGEKIKEYFHEMYPQWGMLEKILPDECWDAIIDGVKVPSADIENWWGIILREEEPPWKKLWRWSTLDDAELATAFSMVVADIKRYRIREPGIILVLLGSALWMSKEKVCDMSPDRIRDFACRYISTLSRKKLFPERFKIETDHFDWRNGFQSCGYSYQETPHFAAVWQHLTAELKDFSAASREEFYSALLDNLSWDEKDFDEWWYRQHHRNNDYYSGQNPQRLLETLSSLSPEALQDRAEAFRGHIQDIAGQDTKTELTFWTEFADLARGYVIQSERVKNNFGKRSIIRNLCKHIESKVNDH